MKLLIDDAKAAFLEMAALCGCYAEGKSVYRDKCPLHCDATIDGFIADRRTLLARIAELERKLEASNADEPGDFTKGNY